QNSDRHLALAYLPEIGKPRFVGNRDHEVTGLLNPGKQTQAPALRKVWRFTTIRAQHAAECRDAEIHRSRRAWTRHTKSDLPVSDIDRRQPLGDGAGRVCG